MTGMNNMLKENSYYLCKKCDNYHSNYDEGYKCDCSKTSINLFKMNSIVMVCYIISYPFILLTELFSPYRKKKFKKENIIIK